MEYNQKEDQNLADVAQSFLQRGAIRPRPDVFCGLTAISYQLTAFSSSMRLILSPIRFALHHKRLHPLNLSLKP